jgi:hypothetical protein
MAVNFQGGKFDVPDRIFFDIASTWKSVLTSVSDVKELIPEFFCCPEIFINSNQLPLGTLQDDVTKVDDVVLPPWAKDPFDFILKNREALESDYVSENLHHWIDLIFGYKQTGEAAIEAKNVFYYLTYENAIDIDDIDDPMLKEATICQIINFGQTPSQLLDKPHVSRLLKSECLYCFSSDFTDRMIHFTPNFAGNSHNQPVVSIRTSMEKLVTLHADGGTCQYRWSILRDLNNAVSLHVSLDKLKTLEIDAKKVRQLVKEDSTTVSHHQDSGEMVRSGALFLEGDKYRVNFRSCAVALSVSDNSVSRVISCGYWDDALRVYSIETGREVTSAISGHVGAITCVQIDRQGGSTLVTGGADGTCRVWVLENPSVLYSFYDELRPAGIDSGFYDSSLVCLHVLCGHLTPIVDLCYSVDMDIVMSSSEEGTLCLHTVRKGTFIRTVVQRTGIIFDRLHISRQGYMFAHSSKDLTLTSYWINGQELASVRVYSRYGV